MKNLILLSTLSLGVFSQNSEAGLFRLTNRQYGTANAAQQAQLDNLFNQLESEVNAKIPSADNANDYGEALSNSQAASTGLLGADYSTSFHKGILGVQLIAGTKLGDSQEIFKVLQGEDKLQESKGVGASTALYAGIPLSVFSKDEEGWMKWNHVKAFIGFMSLKKDFSELSLKSTSLSAKLQYKYLPGNMNRFTRWNGVDFTAGFIYSKVNIGFSKAFTENKSVAVDGAGTATGSVAGTGVISGDLNTFVVPLEASTSVRLLYALGFFGGLGVDLGTSKAKVATRLDNAAANFTSTLGAATATPELDLAVDKKGSPLGLRTFLGTQLELGVIALEAHLSRSWISGAWGLGASVKGFW